MWQSLVSGILKWLVARLKAKGQADLKKYVDALVEASKK